ncbi:MAG: hypothetical protein KIS89_12885, partial [Dokdonella sp.]|nr:hypothetical protein [Dokdonella sp.]
MFEIEEVRVHSPWFAVDGRRWWSAGRAKGASITTCPFGAGLLPVAGLAPVILGNGARSDPATPAAWRP